MSQSQARNKNISNDNRHFEADSFLRNVSTKPGVYRMLDGDGKVLYVGKARNLKKRVASYFSNTRLPSRTRAMVRRVCDVEITVTMSETEALLLEQSLIKRLEPPYNVIFRDNKTYPFIHVSNHPEFPRLSFYRGSRKVQGQFFGPFPSARAARQSLTILQRLFTLRTCEDSFFEHRTRPCLEHQIKRCSAPCVGKIDAKSYAEDTAQAVMFLEGRNRAVLDEFTDAMHQASQRLDYETAARRRDQIAALQQIQEQQGVYTSDGDLDVLAARTEHGIACVHGVFVRGGLLIGQKTWFPRDALDQTNEQMLETFAAQYYLGGAGMDIPQLIITEHELESGALLADVLSDQANKKVRFTSRVRGRRRRWLEQAAENAAAQLKQRLSRKQTLVERILALQDALGLDALPDRLECFDISHASGEATVASCVVFDGNGPKKSDYRRFNIEGVKEGDDYGALRQALTRRFAKLARGEGQMPGILVIDGGPRQVDVAVQVLAEYGLTCDEGGIVIIGISKGPGRKSGLESFTLGSGAALPLDPHNPAMHLLQHIRDEAHRFALHGHRQRRQKVRRESVLDMIAGVGSARKRSLLQHFGSLASLKGASVEEVAKVQGISQSLAAHIREQLESA